MGAYTWTFIRVDKLTKEQVKSCVDHAVWLNSGSDRYSKYSKMTEEEYVKDWIDFHHKEYDYFVNKCDVPIEKMTDEYLTKDIKKQMKQWFYKQECYQKCLNGTMTVEDMLRKTHQLTDRSTLDDFYVIKRKGHYYVQINHEIFRNYEYCDEEFDTVESLIKHLEDPKCKNIMDFSLDKNDMEYRPLTPELKQKIIDYYTAIGDYNFIVHFG